ncbi:hypothetical protein COX69_00300, partial [Candidatus Falkowbacteria bacterium CG_4_10_14_0_2_um_filter_48_10]
MHKEEFTNTESIQSQPESPVYQEKNLSLEKYKQKLLRYFEQKKILYKRNDLYVMDMDKFLDPGFIKKIKHIHLGMDNGRRMRANPWKAIQLLADLNVISENDFRKAQSDGI